MNREMSVTLKYLERGSESYARNISFQVKETMFLFIDLILELLMTKRLH